ncbi:MAG: hypothetical protein E4H41_06255, partial [Gemmatimonadales bacterium]
MIRPLAALLALSLALPVTATAQQTRAKADSARRDSMPKSPPGPGGTSLPNANPFPSTYTPFPSRPTLITNVTIL